MSTETQAELREVELWDAERRLQAAQLASDVEGLDNLLDDRLVFTGPAGRLYSKQDDLELHRSGRQVLSRVEEEDLSVLVDGTIGVSWFLGTLEGAGRRALRGAGAVHPDVDPRAGGPLAAPRRARQRGQRELSAAGVHDGHRHAPIGIPSASRATSVGPSCRELSQTRVTVEAEMASATNGHRRW
jgi:hypothetical protein